MNAEVQLSNCQTARYDYIDALRGWAIVAVVATHLLSYMTPDSGGRLKGFLTYGLWGVQLFFVASALTLWMSCASRIRKSPEPNTCFFVRRFFRIAPLFYFGLIFYSFVWHCPPSWKNPFTNLEGKLFNLLFLNAWSIKWFNTEVPGGWSVAVEMSFYLFVPLLFRRIQTLRQALYLFVLASSICVLSDIWVSRHFGVLDHAHSNFFGHWLPSQMPVFAGGIVAWALLFRSPIATLHASLRRPISITMIAGAMLALCILIILYRRNPHNIFSSPVVAIAFTSFAVGLSLHPWKLFVNGILNRLGKLSYSLYLMHFIGLGLTVPIAERVFRKYFIKVALFEDWLPYGCLLVGLLFSAALAYLTYTFIERPGIAFGQRIIAGMISRRNRSAVAECRSTT